MLLRSRRGESQTNWGAVVTGNIALFVLLSSVILLGFEIYFRFLYDASDGDNRTRVSQRWFARHWSTNNIGVRDDVDYSHKLAPDRRRVTFVGDSFTAGHGVVDVGARFANRLRESNPDWEVHALAHPGLETPDEIRLLKRLIDNRGYELDVVLLVYYIENIGRFVEEAHRYFAEAGTPAPSFWRFVGSYSYALDLFYHRWRRLQASDEGFWTELYRRAYTGFPWKAQRSAFSRFRRLVRGHGGCFAVVTFPTLAGGIEGVAEIQQEIDAHWDEQGVPHLALLPVFEPHDSDLLVANSNDAHPSAFAHELAAEALQEFLERDVLTGSEPGVCPE